MEGESKPNIKVNPLIREGAVHELHELEVSAEDNISDEDYLAFKSLMSHVIERKNKKDMIHLVGVNPDLLGKLEALMYRWARTVQKGTDEFRRFTKEKDSIESLLRESRGVPAVESRIAFYEFLTNLIEAPIEKRIP